MPPEMVFGRILPGVAASLLIGNLFYTFQARALARRTGQPHVTALPYGVNTVSLFAYILFVMKPMLGYVGIAGVFLLLGMRNKPEAT